VFTEQAKIRAEELGVADQVKFIHGDAAGYVSDEKASVQPVSAPLGSPVESSALSNFWRGACAPEGSSSSATLLAAGTADGRCCQGVSCQLNLRFSHASRTSRVFRTVGYDVVEMVLADQDGWDRYEAAKWLTMRRWLEANPDDEFAKDVRATDLGTERYAAYTREYLGWGVFALIAAVSVWCIRRIVNGLCRATAGGSSRCDCA